MATILITGGTGLIGKSLTTLLTGKGFNVIIVSRKPNETDKNPLVSYAGWSIENKEIDSEAIAKADYIIHLAGANVMEKSWSKKYQKEIVESRTKSSELLIKALKEIPNNVKAVISASAIGWYGKDLNSATGKGFRENDLPANDFLGETCRLWEESLEPVTKLNIRLVKLRTGIVLSNDGGAFAEFKKPLQFGVAAILGSGKQMVSWIHLDDLCRMYLYAIENYKVKGSYNAVAPYPVTNKKLTLSLAKVMRGKFFIPAHVPQFFLKLFLGERSIEILKSTTVSAEKIKDEGFTFLYPTIEETLDELSGK